MPAQAWVTLIVGLVAIGGVLITWWRRVTWAFERTFSADDTEAALGWKMLDTLLQSKLATRGDSDIVQVIGEHTALDEVEDQDDEAEEGSVDGHDERQRQQPPEAEPENGS
jgi:hypothetical protein